MGALSSYSFVKFASKNYYDAMKILDARSMLESTEKTYEVKSETANASIDFDIDEREEKIERIDDPVDYGKTVYADESDLGLDLDDYEDLMQNEPNLDDVIFDEPIYDEPEREDIIRRVERIARYGASIDEMKEVATLLRLERAKPENRSPYRKKRLDDAFASLLRSASNAKK